MLKNDRFSSFLGLWSGFNGLGGQNLTPMLIFDRNITDREDFYPFEGCSHLKTPKKAKNKLFLCIKSPASPIIHCGASS
jgi:hypothetical protein